MSRSPARSRLPTHRSERVGERIRQEIAAILARGQILDAALVRHPTTVSAVRMSPDLRMATVTVTPLGGEGAEATLEALNRHRKELRALVAGRVKLKFAPDLRFSLDSSFDAQARIDALLRSPEVVRDLDRRKTANEDQS